MLYINSNELAHINAEGERISLIVDRAHANISRLRSIRKNEHWSIENSSHRTNHHTSLRFISHWCRSYLKTNSMSIDRWRILLTTHVITPQYGLYLICIVQVWHQSQWALVSFIRLSKTLSETPTSNALRGKNLDTHIFHHTVLLSLDKFHFLWRFRVIAYLSYAKIA